MGVLDLFSLLPTFLWIIIALCLLIYLYGIWPYLTSEVNLDGPKPSPFVGNVLQANEKGHIIYDRENLKQYGDMYLSWSGRTPVVNVANPDVVKEVCIKEFSKFTNRPSALPISKTQKNMVSDLLDDHWKFVRSVLTPTFSSGKMRRMVPLIDTCLSRLLANLEKHSKNGGSFEAKQLMGGLTMEIIGAVGFGIDIDVQKDLNNKFMTMAKRVLANSNMSKIYVQLSFFFPFLIPMFEAVNLTTVSKDVTDYFVDMLTKTIKERRQNPSNRKDFLQLMIDSSLEDIADEARVQGVNPDALKVDNLKRDKKLTDDEVIAQALIFLIAGFETTAAALAFLSYNLAVNPDCQERLTQEIDEILEGTPPTYDNVLLLPYLDMCLCESQRLYPVARGSIREASQETVLAGVRVPAGTSVELLGYALQHDERYWPKPETFDPNRFSPEENEKRNPYVYFPFGLGPRNCVGMRLAKMEAKMTIVSILQKYRFTRAPETEVPLTLKKGIFIQAEHGIWLKVEAR